MAFDPYLACWFNLTLSRSCSKVEVIGQSSRSQDETTATALAVESAVTAHWMYSQLAASGE